MAARNKPLHPIKVAEMREKIRATLLIKKLENHVLDNAGLDASQVTAALGLLKKIVPDLSAVELSSDPEKPVEIVNRIELVALKKNDYSKD